MIQLHGGETPERAAEIRAAHRPPGDQGHQRRARGRRRTAPLPIASAADLILFDAKPPRDSARLPGGNGLAFDWRLLAPLRGKMRFMLSGGLTPANVAEAIACTGAAIVDVSSGVETRARRKGCAR